MTFAGCYRKAIRNVDHGLPLPTEYPFQFRNRFLSQRFFHDPFPMKTTHLKHAGQGRKTGLTTGSMMNIGVTSTIHKLSIGGHRVATLTISNPAKLNVVNSALLDQMVVTCDQLSQDSNLRAVILTGVETAPTTAFIGGADITEMRELSSAQDARRFILRIHHACKALRELPVPVIARVHGYALGAGLEIMAACDLRIATAASIFGMPEVKVGIPSVVEAALLPGLIGFGRTRRLLYLAEHIDAKTAEQWGLVERVVDGRAELDAAVDEWVQTIAGMGPAAIRSQKRLMQKWENCTTEEAIGAGVESFAHAFADGGTEPRELMGQFVRRKR